MTKISKLATVELDVYFVWVSAGQVVGLETLQGSQGRKEGRRICLSSQVRARIICRTGLIAREDMPMIRRVALQQVAAKVVHEAVYAVEYGQSQTGDFLRRALEDLEATGQRIESLDFSVDKPEISEESKLAAIKAAMPPIKAAS